MVFWRITRKTIFQWCALTTFGGQNHWIEKIILAKKSRRKMIQNQKWLCNGLYTFTWQNQCLFTRTIPYIHIRLCILFEFACVYSLKCKMEFSRLTFHMSQLQGLFSLIHFLQYVMRWYVLRSFFVCSLILFFVISSHWIHSTKQYKCVA